MKYDSSSQVLGEGENEVVTLSHRAQIKRMSNDITRLLRPQNLKCVSTRELPRKLVELWNNRSIDKLDVSHFGVCYLDDLIVTIPQHWGVCCSEYVGQDGLLVMRHHGDRLEDVPESIELGYRPLPASVSYDPHSRVGLGNSSLDDTSEENLDGYGVVHMWVPKKPRTDCEWRRLSILREQVIGYIIFNSRDMILRSPSS